MNKKLILIISVLLSFRSFAAHLMNKQKDKSNLKDMLKNYPKKEVKVDSNGKIASKQDKVGTWTESTTKVGTWTESTTKVNNDSK